MIAHAICVPPVILVSGPVADRQFALPVTEMAVDVFVGPVLVQCHVDTDTLDGGAAKRLGEVRVERADPLEEDGLFRFNAPFLRGEGPDPVLHGGSGRGKVGTLRTTAD